MPTRRASAVWEGGRKGKGSFSGESGAIGGSYSFGSRFENATGSNPEELLAAAEAACFSMAFGLALEKNGTPPTRVETKAACSIESVDGGFRITRMALTVEATVPGIQDADFQKIATGAVEGCPVSKALAGNMEITLDARLV